MMNKIKNVKTWRGKNVEPRGRFEVCRTTYFKQRSPARTKQLLSLLNDVEYLISEIRALEQKIKYTGPLSRTLHILYLRLCYLHYRKDYKSDAAFIRHYAEEFNLEYASIQIQVFSKDIDTYFWLTTTEPVPEEETPFPVIHAKCPYCRRVVR